MKLVSISSIQPATKKAVKKIKNLEGLHSLDDTLNYLVNLDRQIRKSGVPTITELVNYYNVHNGKLLQKHLEEHLRYETNG